MARKTPGAPGGTPGYVAAVLATALAILLRWAVGRLLGHLLPLSTRYGSVALAVWYGG